MIQLILGSFLVLIPLNVLVVFLTLRAGQKEYAASADQDATISVVMRWFSRYLVVSAIVLICVYLAITLSIMHTIFYAVMMTSLNLVLLVVIYAVMGSLQSGNIKGGSDE